MPEDRSQTDDLQAGGHCRNLVGLCQLTMETSRSLLRGLAAGTVRPVTGPGPGEQDVRGTGRGVPCGTGGLVTRPDTETGLA